MRKFIILVVVYVGILNSQVVLEKELFTGKQYTLNFVNTGYPYSVNKEKNSDVIVFDHPEDESLPGAYRLPQKDIFIALPNDPNFSYLLTVQQSGKIAGVTPKRTSVVRRVNDSLLQYSAGEEGMSTNLPSKSVEFKGFLWISGTYCGHFILHPYTFDAGSSTVTELKKFRLQITFSNPPKTSGTGRGTPLHPIIINASYGPQWETVPRKARTTGNDSWINYTQDFIKLGVVRDAVQRLNFTALKNAGVPVNSVDPSTFRLFLKGKEIPLYVSGSGPTDLVFDSTDFIEFVGRKNYGDTRYRQIAPSGESYYEYLNLYSDTSIYWLTWGGSQGKRIDTTSAVSGSVTDTIKYYDELIHRETNLYFDFSYANQVEREYPFYKNNKTWLDNGVAVGTLTSTFSVSNLYPGRPARAFIKLQDFSSSITTNAHNLSLSLNNFSTTYDSGFINKYQMKVMQADFNSSLLTNGNNSIKLNSYSVPANTVNVVLRDWAELEYPRLLKVTGDTLAFAYRNFSGTKNAQFIISGLSNNPLSLFRFRHSDSTCLKITNFTRNADTLKFIDSVSEGVQYFLASAQTAVQPLIYYKKKFVNLRDPNNSAEYLAITHPYFQSIGSNYTSFIASTYNIATRLVSINDIFDEFSYGFPEPESIKEFLQTSHANWQSPKPKYVLLIGKATYDYYGNKSKSAGAPKVINFVPSYGAPVSDNWFVMWDTTGALIPQMSIGRIPAKNIDEFQSYFLKHQKYVSKGYDEWNKRFMFFSGGNINDPNQISQAKGINDLIINSYTTGAPIGGIVSSFYKTVNPITNFGPYSPDVIKNSLERGSVFISYIGHSGTQTWDNSITDISQLSNTRDRNPMVTDFGCSTGKFAEPDILSFSELAVNSSQGQAIAYVGNSSLGFTSTAYTFPQIFYKKLLRDTTAPIGDIHRLAKLDYLKLYGTSGTYGLFTLTNTMIGDPIVRLPIPTRPNLSFTNSIVNVVPAIPSDQDDSLRLTVNYFNYGSVSSDSVRVTIKDLYSGGVVYSREFSIAMPLFSDTAEFVIPVKGRPGEHSLTITFDPLDVIDEIYENDNSLGYTYVVVSNSVRTVTLHSVNMQSNGLLKFLNPVNGSLQSDLIVDISSNSLFTSLQSRSVPFGTFATSFTLDTAYRGTRVWIRPKLIGSNTEGISESFIYGNTNSFLLKDSLSWSTVTKTKSKIQNNTIVLDTNTTVIGAISAGFNDGNTGVILKDGQNLVPENTIRGHHIALFDATTLEYKGYYLFDVTWGAASAVTNYKNLLDTLTSNYLVVFSICSEGGGPNLSTALKNSIKSFGSKLIDSVKSGYYSWAMIGRKGAISGSVQEKFSKPFAGRVQIDTSIRIPYRSDTIRTQMMGPVHSWKTLKTNFSNSFNSGITLNLLAFKRNAVVPDTVLKNIPIDTLVSLSSIDASNHPYLQVAASLSAGSNNESPTLSRIEVDYTSVPELGTNYQVFSLYRLVNDIQGAAVTALDSIVQGEKLLLKFQIHNAGGSTAKNIPLTVSSLWDNNYLESIISQTIDSIPANGFKELTTTYNTSLGTGKRNLQISIDPDSLIVENYKDNNFYTFPIIIKKSQGNPILPNLSIAQNAVSSLPAEITDETDTAKFSIIYSNTGSLVNDSISIQVKHYYQSELLSTSVIRRKYPVSYDTLTVKIPVLKNAGQHQLTIDLDHTGLIVESSESDNSSSYFFTVATTDFKVLFPTQNSISSVDKIIFLNPTTAGAASIVTMELDTIAAFTTAQAFSKTLQPFATTFPLPDLKKKKRYFWRAKVQGSSHDWTVGSFYSGDSAVSSLGQIDSVAWKLNLFTRTSFTPDSGARIVDTRTIIKASSAGFNDGNIGSVTVNGINVVTPIIGSGHNVVVLDSTSFAVESLRRFNITSDPNEADSLVQFIGAVAAGKYVIDVIVDEGANNLHTAARNALKSIGSSKIDQVSFRDSWSIVGRKGAAPGSVTETYRAQNSGSALSETTVVRSERTGTIETPLIGPFSTLSSLSVDQVIPSGAQITVQLIGISPSKTLDTLLTVQNQSVISLASVNTKLYRNGKLLFRLTAPPALRTSKRTAAAQSPSVMSWKMTAQSSTELAVSSKSTTIDRNQVMEGEQIQFSAKVFNVSNVPADSVLVQLKTNASGIDNVLMQQRYVRIPANDSVSFSFGYDTRGKRGNHSFMFEIDPKDSLSEQSKSNNTVSVPYIVQADTLRPTLQVTFDGNQVLNGDHVSRQPEIKVRFTDNNPAGLLASDTSNFRIRLNNQPVHFIAGTAELTGSATAGRADVRWTPTLLNGENIIQISAKDVSENYSDTILLYVNVASEFMIMDLFNLPNPFTSQTAFTFNLAGPRNPDEVIIKIYTVAGRLIQEMNVSGIIGFNKIPWDGRDKDGDQIGNGVYLYKVIIKQGEKQIESISKLVKMR